MKSEVIKLQSNFMSHRILKINELIKKELGKILAREIEFPLDTLATITQVKTNRDLNFTTVWVSILPAQKTGEVLKILDQQKYNLQNLLNKKIFIKKVPKIIFKIDTTEEEAAQTEALLDTLKSE